MPHSGWSDYFMIACLAVYGLAIAAHVSIGKSMFRKGAAYPPLSSSHWVPSSSNARQQLLLGMYWVAVPPWIAHVVSLAIVARFAHAYIPVAGVIAAFSTAAQGFVTVAVLGGKRAPGKTLIAHYLLQTVAALVWAVEHARKGCSG